MSGIDQVGSIIRYASDNKRLKEIIKGKKTRQFFENYLNPLCMWGFSPRYIQHPKDVYRLDRFICAISRFGSKIDVYQLERYLVEDLAWSIKNSHWVRQRIEIGLAILKANKNFPG